MVFDFFLPRKEQRRFEISGMHAGHLCDGREAWTGRLWVRSCDRRDETTVFAPLGWAGTIEKLSIFQPSPGARRQELASVWGLLAELEKITRFEILTSLPHERFSNFFYWSKTFLSNPPIFSAVSGLLGKSLSPSLKVPFLSPRYKRKNSGKMTGGDDFKANEGSGCGGNEGQEKVLAGKKKNGCKEKEDFFYYQSPWEGDQS